MWVLGFSKQRGLVDACQRVSAVMRREGAMPEVMVHVMLGC